MYARLLGFKMFRYAVQDLNKYDNRKVFIAFKFIIHQ